MRRRVNALVGGGFLSLTGLGAIALCMVLYVESVRLTGPQSGNPSGVYRFVMTRVLEPLYIWWARGTPGGPDPAQFAGFLTGVLMVTALFGFVLLLGAFLILSRDSHREGPGSP